MPLGLRGPLPAGRVPGSACSGTPPLPLETLAQCCEVCLPRCGPAAFSEPGLGGLWGLEAQAWQAVGRGPAVCGCGTGGGQGHPTQGVSLSAVSAGAQHSREGHSQTAF